MMRKVFVSALVILATLVIVPSVLAALTSPSAFGRSPFTHGDIVTRGWASPHAIDAKGLRVGVSVTQSLTIANEGSLPATYRLRARISGDRGFAGRLSVVATRRSDGATIFSGPATRIGRFDLGRFAPGQQETLRLRLVLTSTGTDVVDNAFRGRAASVAFTWTATRS
jgi:hypothetical protein